MAIFFYSSFSVFFIVSLSSLFQENGAVRVEEVRRVLSYNIDSSRPKIRHSSAKALCVEDCTGTYWNIIFSKPAVEAFQESVVLLKPPSSLLSENAEYASVEHDWPCAIIG
jgi:hypothetical protein